MGKDLSGPNFNNYDDKNKTNNDTVENMAKRAKKALFTADEDDIKSIAKDLMKDPEEADDLNAAAGAMNKAERDAKNTNSSGNFTEAEVGVSMKEMKDKLDKE